MYICSKCNREFDSFNKLNGHKSFCGKERNHSGINNPNYGKKGKNQYIKAREEGREFIPSKKEIEGRRKTSIARNKKRWDNPRARENFSKAIQKAIKRNPEAYSASNVCGRTKLYEAIDSFGNDTKLNGKWELLVADFLNKNGINWTNKIKPFEYEWQDKIHLYFPDFYLPDFDKYVEVKGYERERDRAKWKSVKNLLVLKRKEIKEIQNGNSAVAEWPIAHPS